MSIELAVPSPLADALNNIIKPKLVEIGWATGGGDESALSEYIILMLSNGKTQEQIATEISSDLLSLGSDDPGARDFALWLFQQATALHNQLSTGSAVNPDVATDEAMNDGQDAEMDDATVEPNIPTGPRSMRNTAGRDKRMFGQLTKTLDRSRDSVLHRVRAQGGERINSHSRNAPAGPRNQNGRGGRMNRNPMGGMPMPGVNPAMSSLTPQQQMEVLSMFEQQAQAMAEQWQHQFQGPNNRGRGQGKSLFDRVQGKPQRAGRDRQRPADAAEGDVDMSSEGVSGDAVCKYNLHCTNKDCKFAHQSPATIPGTPVAIDLSDNCAFGAACKNRKCTARHPSPAQKKAHQEVQDCKYWPNCTNTHCPFRHTPICRNGPDCTTPNCKFTHVTTACKFDPCLNPKCPYKHAEGQRRGTFEDKVWTKDQGHISERKFVEDENAQEELIIPGVSETKTEVVT